MKKSVIFVFVLSFLFSLSLWNRIVYGSKDTEDMRLMIDCFVFKTIPPEEAKKVISKFSYQKIGCLDSNQEPSALMVLSHPCRFYGCDSFFEAFSGKGSYIHEKVRNSPLQCLGALVIFSDESYEVVSEYVCKDVSSKGECKRIVSDYVKLTDAFDDEVEDVYFGDGDAINLYPVFFFNDGKIVQGICRNFYLF